MVDELEPDTKEKIQALCKKISVAHNLDSEIQEELRSHMEDKLLAYLNGEETVGEEDAFILVREHFGDPSTLKGLLQDVHALKAQVSLARRLAAAIIVSSGVVVTFFYLNIAAFRVWHAFPIGSAYAYIAALVPVYVVLPWLLLRHWQRQLNAGNNPWFLRWRPVYLVGALGVLLVLQSLQNSSVGMLFTQAGIHPLLNRLFVSATPVLQCTIWLWWCDRPPRKARAVGNAAGIWAVWAWSSTSVAIIRITASSWNTQSIATHLALTFCVMVIYAFVAYGLYAMARRAAAGSSRRPAKS